VVNVYTSGQAFSYYIDWDQMQMLFDDVEEPDIITILGRVPNLPSVTQLADEKGFTLLHYAALNDRYKTV
jgi:ankyrin repeat protein